MASRHAEWIASLPADWRVVPLRDVGDLVGGGTPSRAVPTYWGGDIPWATPTDVTGLRGRYLRRTSEQITRKGIDGSAATVLPTDSILITTRATIGEIALAGSPMATNQGFHSLVRLRAADPRFYYHVLRLISREMQRLGSGSTFAEISASDLGSILVPQPGLEEQQAIARVLDEAEDTALEDESALAKATMICDGLTDDLIFGSRRLPSFDARRTGRQELGWNGSVPIEWSVRPLGDLLERNDSGVWGLDPTIEDATPVLRSTDITIDGRWDLSEPALRRLSPAERGAAFLRKDDLVLTRSSGSVHHLGKTGLVTDAIARSGACFSNFMQRLRVGPDLDPYFTYLLVNSRPGRRQLVFLGTTSTGLANLTGPMLDALPIPVPPIHEQRTIAAVIAHARGLVDGSRHARAKHEAVYAGIARDLISGRRRLSRFVPELAAGAA